LVKNQPLNGAGKSPFSGLQLSFLFRYQIDATALLRRNWRYSFVLFLANYLALQRMVGSHCKVLR